MNYASIEKADQFSDTPAGQQQLWLSELAAAKKAAKKWQDAGKRITKIYLDERAQDHGPLRASRLNLFTSNVGTMRALLYGKVPSVEVGRRYEDANDDAARVAAEILERQLNADIGKEFSWAIGEALGDRLLVGFGLGKVRYEADFETEEVEAIVAEDGTVLAEGYEEERKTSESAPVDYVNWRDVLWSPARTWDEVRWFGFRNYMTRDQLIERFGEKIGEAVPLQTSRGSKQGIEFDAWQRAEVWEIWCKDKTTVYWISEGMDVILDAKEDPLELEGFYPNPMPMMANVASGSYTPRADYILAQDQYEEINDLTTRITLLQRAVKMVGVYDRGSVGVQRMLTEGVENDLIPVDNWAMFAEKGGIKGQVDWLPIGMVVEAVQVLSLYRGELINLMFQVTGMSDILRGSTESGETATAQSLKARFASTRVQYLQDDFARFATDLQRLRAEIMVKHFDDQTLIQGANMEHTPDAEHLMPALELLRSNGAAFRIEIKSEALAMEDMAALRQEKGAFIEGLSMFLSAAMPLAERHPEATPALLEMLKWTMSGFKGASTIEGVLDRAIASMQQTAQGQQGQPQQPDPEQVKAQAEMAKVQARSQAEMQKIQARSQADMQKQQSATQGALAATQAATQGRIEVEAAQALFDTPAGGRIAADMLLPPRNRPRGF